MDRRLALTSGVIAGALGAWAAARPRLMGRGATAAERARPLPGDGVVPRPVAESTMAATLPGPPPRVWPWLVQMGFGRAGWYSFDLLDNAGRRSAEAILPEHQRLAPGERVPSSPRTWFTVAEAVPDRALVLRYRGSAAGRMLAPDEPLPWGGVDSTWALVLEPAGDGTRLLVRSRATGRPRWLARAACLLLWDPGHLLMQRRQLGGLRRRVAGRAGGTPPDGAPPPA